MASPSKAKLDRDAAWERKKIAASASLDDYRKELPKGSVRVTEKADGTCEGQVVGREAVLRLMQMTEERRRLEVEQSAERSAEVERSDVPEMVKERAARKGRRAPSFGYSRRYSERYERVFGGSR